MSNISCEKIRRNFYTGFNDVETFIEVKIGQKNFKTKKRGTIFSKYFFSSNQYSDTNSNLVTFSINSKEFLIFKHKNSIFDSAKNSSEGNVSLSYRDIPILQTTVNNIFNLMNTPDKIFSMNKEINEWVLTEYGNNFRLATKPFHDSKRIIFEPVILDLNESASDLSLNDLTLIKPGILMYIESIEYPSYTTLEEFNGFRYNLNSLNLLNISQQLIQTLSFYDKV
jgi:hypothetical protein